MAAVYHEIVVTCSSLTQFPVILLNDLRAWPDDVIRPRPLRPSVLWLAINGRPMDVAENLGELICEECTGQGNDSELIPTVKMKIDIP